MLKRVGFLTLLLALTSCYEVPPKDDFIPVITKNGMKYIPHETFSNSLSPLLQSMSKDVTATLDTHEKTEGMPWKLSRVTVGLALATEVDLFEVAEGEIEGVLELRFQKK